jgi:hypothetical protein
MNSFYGGLLKEDYYNLSLRCGRRRKNLNLIGILVQIINIMLLCHEHEIQYNSRQRNYILAGGVTTLLLRIKL